MASISRTLFDVVQTVVDDTAHPKTVALFFRDDAGPVSGLEKQGDVAGSELVELCRICAGGPDGRSPEWMVLASWRPGEGAQATDGDRSTWRAMLDELGSGATQLLDWLLIDGSWAYSVASGCRWQAR